MYAYHLQVFQAVARYRSYSRAAREALHISQPAVSKHVQALEASLGLAGETWVLREPGSASHQVVEQALTTHGVAWQGDLHMPNNEAMKQAIIAGLGIGMVSRLAVMLELRQGLLSEISVANLQVDRQISVVYRIDVAPSAAARAFLEVLSHHDPGLSA